MSLCIFTPKAKLVPIVRPRSALIGFAGLTTLMTAYAGAALAGSPPCSTSGSTATCTGDQSAGIVSNIDFLAPPVDTLNVNGLTQTIGGGGIFFDVSTGPVTINATGSGTVSPDPGVIGILAQSSFGDITIGSSFNVSTTGDGAAGIVGSVSNVGFNTVITSSGNISTTGKFADGIDGLSAGNVTISSSGTISTTGLNGNGILGLGQGTGIVTITSSSNISTTGPDATGIVGQNSNNITVNILGGTVSGGTGTGVGVAFIGGFTNTLNNSGTIQALSLTAVTGTHGSETINNSGTINGSIDLGTGANAFNNQVGGTFNAGPTVNLGAGNTLQNDGNLSPGGFGTIKTTNLTGNLIQTSTGTYTVDVNWTAPSADLIHVVGGTAQLAGTVIVNPINFPTTAGLHQQFTILHTDAPGDITNNGITPISTAAVSYLLLFPVLQDMVLDATINFTGVGLGGLNPNQTAIGDNLNAIQQAGAPPAMSALMTALMTLPTQQSLANALDQLSPEIYNYDLIETLYASQQFSNDMMSCRVAGENGAAFIREGQCIWARARARFLELDHTTNNIGADDTTGSFSAGAQLAFAPDWRLGFAAGYDRIQLDTSTGATSDGDRANVGGVVKYNPGPLLVAAGVTAGWGSYDTTRTLAFGGFNAVATSNNDINYVSGQLHAAYLFSQGNWYLKPLVDAGVTELDLNGFTEHGGGGAALIVPGRSDTVFNVSPALEIGTEMRFDNVSVWRPFVRAGATWQDTGSFVLNAGFFDAPQGVSPFTIRTKLDQVLADVGAGVDIINTAGAVLRVQYDGKFAQDTQQNGVSLKGSVPF